MAADSDHSHRHHNYLCILYDYDDFDVWKVVCRMNHIRLGILVIDVFQVVAADEALDVLFLGWMVPESDPKVVVVRRALLHRLVKKGMMESYAGIVFDGEMLYLMKKGYVHHAANSVEDVVSFRSVPVSLWIHAFRLPSQIHRILKANNQCISPSY